MKECSKCKQLRTEENFSWKIKGKARSGVCKDCHSQYRRAHYLANKEKYIQKARAWEALRGGKQAARHNLTAEQITKLFDKYDGKCWCCRTKDATYIDHDHDCCAGYTTCGKCVRGFLCSTCNTGIGLLGDNLQGLNNAVEYLSRKH